MESARVADGYQFSFLLVDSKGSLITGAVAGDFTATVLNPADDATLTPTVSETASVPGLYTFLVTSAFLTTNGVGVYRVVVQVAKVTAVKIDDAMHSHLQVTQEGLDTIAAAVWDEASATHVAAGTTGFILAALDYGHAVWIDTISGSAGAVVGVNGIPENPVDNLADAVTLAAALGFRNYNLRGTIVLTSAHDGWVFEGIAGEANVNISGQDVSDSLFKFTDVSGIVGNGPIRLEQCLLDGLTFSGLANQCRLRDTAVLQLQAGTTTFTHCTSDVPGLTTPAIDMVGAGISLNVRAYSGGLEIRNMTDVGQTATVELIAGQIILASTCSAGNITLRGVGNLTDNSTGTTVEQNALLNRSALVDATWDESLAGHSIGGSAGKALKNAADYVITDGTSDNVPANTANTISLQNNSSAIDDFYNHQQIIVTGGTGSEQVRQISDYDGTTKVATITPAWSTIPDVTSQYQIMPGVVHAETQGTGYMDGAIWIAPAGLGSLTALQFVDGTADNPLDATLFNDGTARIMADALNLVEFRFLPGTSVVLDQSYDNRTLSGDHWVLALNGQSISNSTITRADVSGVSVSASSHPHFHQCDIGAVTLSPSNFFTCQFLGAFTVGAAGDFLFDQCLSGVAGVATPIFDWVLAIGPTDMNFRHWSGGIEMQNMVAGDLCSIEGHGQVIFNANCTGGTAAIRGAFNLTDNAGTVTVSDSARYEVSKVVAAIWAQVIDDSLTAADALKYTLAMAAGNFVETDKGGGVTEFAFKDHAGTTTVYTIEYLEDTSRTRTTG